MFGTDWLMLSQVPNWRVYPQRVREGLEAIAGAEDVAKILGGNARKCFARIAT
jgi:predicted TIM-barrel fold metal-dependent hydrolase